MSAVCSPDCINLAAEERRRTIGDAGDLAFEVVAIEQHMHMIGRAMVTRIRHGDGTESTVALKAPLRLVYGAKYCLSNAAAAAAFPSATCISTIMAAGAVPFLKQAITYGPFEGPYVQMRCDKNTKRKLYLRCPST